MAHWYTMKIIAFFLCLHLPTFRNTHTQWVRVDRRNKKLNLFLFYSSVWTHIHSALRSVHHTNSFFVRCMNFWNIFQLKPAQSAFVLLPPIYYYFFFVHFIFHFSSFFHWKLWNNTIAMQNGTRCVYNNQITATTRKNIKSVHVVHGFFSLVSFDHNFFFVFCFCFSYFRATCNVQRLYFYLYKPFKYFSLFHSAFDVRFFVSLLP